MLAEAKGAAEALPQKQRDDPEGIRDVSELTEVLMGPDWAGCRGYLQVEEKTQYNCKSYLHPCPPSFLLRREA